MDKGTIRDADNPPEAPLLKGTVYRINVPAFNLRLPEPLKSQIREAAKQNGRSINAEIVQRLKASFEGSWR